MSAIKHLRRVRIGIASLVLAGLATVGISSTAQAVSYYTIWTYGTYEECLDLQQTYISSWTKIYQPCTYYPTGRYFFIVVSQ